MPQDDQRVAIVTGAARSIGAATARRLSADGLAVAVLDLDAAACKATVEEIQSAGGRALAVGADVSQADQVQAAVDKVAAAFKIITSDPNVKGILVNIFGGIMKCDVIAEGVVAAVKQVGLKVPLVVRLEGTNVDAGKKIIRESGLNVVPADNLDDAAQKIVKAVKEAA